MKERDSNMELLRIIAMLMVVIVHTCFYATGTPTSFEVIGQPIVSFLRLLLPAITICGVNMFVLISGWYGIRQSRKGFMNLFFQIFFYLLLTLPAAYLGKGLNTEEFLSYILIYGDDWWFVKSYLLLYIISPLLNIYADRACKKDYQVILIGFFSFMFSWGWLFPGVQWFYGGYSTTSFIGLYLLARYYRLYPDNIVCCLKKNTLIMAYAGVVLLLAIVSYSILRYYTNQTSATVLQLYQYNSPFVVASSFCLFLFFIKISFQSRHVNRIARSIFAVYLIHTSRYIFPFFTIKLYDFYHGHPYYIYLLFSMAYSVFVFILCIIIDQLRITLWRTCFTKLFKS